MDTLGRYYTKDSISRLLINTLETEKPKKILDLGVGNASLSLAAYLKWANAKYYGTEIDSDSTELIEQELSFIKIIKCDTLHPKPSERLRIQIGEIDIAICNPPYVRINNKARYFKLFNSIGCGKFCSLKRITSEIVFLAHNLKLLKDTGELAIIVSDSLITGKEFQSFRETILQEFDVRRVIQLPDKIFNKTEARTHVLFISKTKSSNDFCEINISTDEGRLSPSIIVPKSKLNLRMDFQYHKGFNYNHLKLKTLNQIGAVIKRGFYTYKDLRQQNLPFFHTVSFKEFNRTIKFCNEIPQPVLKHCAISGDIITSRVGKRCIGKFAFIESGSIIVSDCIYRISIPKEYQQAVLKSFQSQEGQAWLKIHAHGVCSQVISKADLENFPLFGF